MSRKYTVILATKLEVLKINHRVFKIESWDTINAEKWIIFS